MFDMTPKHAPSDETTANPNHVEIQIENLEESGSENGKKPSTLQRDQILKPNQITESGNPNGDSMLQVKT